MTDRMTAAEARASFLALERIASAARLLRTIEPRPAFGYPDTLLKEIARTIDDLAGDIAGCMTEVGIDD